MGLARPSIEGPLFIYRAPIQLGGPSPSQIRATTHSSPETILSAIASRFEDLADPVQVEPWRLIPIDTSRGMSRNRELHHPCYMLVGFRAFRSFGLRPHGVMEVVLGQEDFSFPTVLLVGLALVACQEDFFLQVQVWCGPTLMQNMVVAAPLLNGTLHFDMDAITDTSLVRVTIYIPGGNTLTSSRVLTVTCLRAMLETFALGELRSRFRDLREVGFRVIPVHPVVTWHAPVLPLNKEKMVLIYEDVGIYHMSTWDRHVATPDLWPDELIDDITGWFDDLRGRWPDEEWLGLEDPWIIVLFQDDHFATSELCPHHKA